MEGQYQNHDGQKDPNRAVTAFSDGVLGDYHDHGPGLEAASRHEAVSSAASVADRLELCGQLSG